MRIVIHDLLIIACSAAILTLSPSLSGGATIFSEDFEAPVVTGYDQQPPNPTGWVPASAGYRSSWHGLINKDGGAFSAPIGNDQGYAFRYTNSGTTTDEGEIGVMQGNVVYTVSFNYTRDDDSGGTAYNTYFFAVPLGASRSDCRTSVPPGATLLGSAAGTATTNDMSESTSFSFTASAADIFLSEDLGIRLDGASSKAITDNVQVDTVTVPSVYWDINGTTAGSGGATPAGTWDGANTYWNPASDGTGTTAAWASSNNAVFAAGSDASGTYVVTVSGTRDIGSLIFEEGSVTLSGGTALRMIRNCGVEVASGVTATIATPVSQDTAGRTFGKVGAGTLIISGANTYTTGRTLVRDGTLRLGASNVIPNNSIVTVNGNAAGVTATLDLSGYTDTINSLELGGMSTSSGADVTTGAGTLTLAGNVNYSATSNPVGANIIGNLALGSSTRTFTINDSSTATYDLTVRAVISGSGGLTKAGSGTLYLSSYTNTYSGNTTVNAGTLVADAGGSCSNSALTFSGGDLQVGVSNNLLHWGCDGLTYSSAGKMDFDFGATVPSKTVAPLQVDGNVAFAATPTVELTGASLTGLATGEYALVSWTGASSGIAPYAVTLPDGSGTLVLDEPGKTLWLNITGSEQPLTWQGPAASEWKANEVTYTYWQDASPVTTNYREYAVGAVTSGDNVVFDDAGPGGVVTLNTTVYPASVTVSGTKSYTLSGSGNIAGSAPLTMSSSGTLTISTTNTFSGGLAVSGGSLHLNTTNAIGSGGINIDNACTFALSTNVNVGSISYADGSYATTISGGTLNFAANSTIQNANDSTAEQTINSAITGSPDVSIAARANYDGMIFGPTNGSVSLGRVTVPYNDGGNDKCLFRMDGTTTSNSVTEIAVDYEQGRVEKRGSGTWSIGDAGEVGNSSGLGWLDIYEGSLMLTGTVAMKRDHDVELYGGILHYNNEAALRIKPTVTGSLRMKGGALDNSSGIAITSSTHNPPWEWHSDFTFIGSQGTNSDLNFGTGIVTLYADRTVTVSNSLTTLTAGGNISGAFSLTKAGAGTLKLTGNNTYSGDTFVDAGTLAISNDSIIADTSSLYITNGAKVALLGINESVTNLYLDGELVFRGTWGNSGSGAEFENGTYFSGTGILAVADGPVASSSLTNTAATSVGNDSATFNALLTLSNSAVIDVYAHWGTTDGSNSVPAWGDSGFVGTYTGGLWQQSIPFTTNGLTPGTTYYYSFRGTNASTSIWASPSSTFATYDFPIVNNSTGATPASVSSATLRGLLTNGLGAEALFCWGTFDGGVSSTSDWEAAVTAGTVTQSIEFSTLVSGLSTNSSYWYRCYVTNDYGTDWSDTAETFNGTPVNTGGGGSAYSMEITFTNFAGRGTLTNFPALVRFTTNNINNYEGFLDTTNGWDLRFWTNSTLSGTELRYEIESFDTNTNSYAWVRIPELTNNLSIWASWGDAANNSQETYTTNGSVWTNGYVAVYHLHTNSNDSTTNTITALNENGVVTGVGGMVADGVDIQSGAHLDFGGSSWDFMNGTSSKFTLGLWLNLDANAADGTVFGRWNSGPFLFWADSGGVRNYVFYDDGGPRTAEGSGALSAVDEWQYVVATSDGTTISVYVNAGTPNTVAGWNFANSTRKMSVGTEHGDSTSRALDSQVDEVRIASVYRSADWLWAEWMNQGTNHDSFVEYGTPQTAGGAIGNIAPTNVGSGSASANATLEAESTNYTVYVHWGTTDGGTNFSWANSANLGSFGPVTSTNVTYRMTGFAGSTTNYYTFRASNDAGNVWADPSWTFVSALDTGVGSVFLFK